MNVFGSPASSQLSLFSWLSWTHYRDSKAAHHANTRAFTVRWNKKPWRNQTELGSADAQTRRAACIGWRGNPLANTWLSPIPAGPLLCGPGAIETLESIKKRAEEPEAPLFFFLSLFFWTEVPKHSTLFPQQLLMESSYLAALPAGRNLPKQALFKKIKHSRQLSHQAQQQEVGWPLI